MFCNKVFRNIFFGALQQKYAGSQSLFIHYVFAEFRFFHSVLSSQAAAQNNRLRSHPSTNANMKKETTLKGELSSQWFLLSIPLRHSLCKNHFFHRLTFDGVFSDSSKEQFINSVQKMKVMPFNHNKYTRDASVMVPLCRVNGEPSILLTMRSATMGRNKGDVSFPGGMKEISDKSAIDVALRETQEEIGASSNIDVWTVMPPMPSRTGKIKVIPVVAYLGDINLETYSFNKDEVDYIFTLTLESLCNPKNWHYTQFKIGYTLPVYIVDNHRIWGLTAAVLHYTLKALVPDYYTQDIPSGCKKLKVRNCEKNSN